MYHSNYLFTSLLVVCLQPGRNPPKEPNLLGKTAFGEATFWGIEEPTFLKVDLEAC